MVLVRPVTSADLDGLVELASLAGVGLTTLPKDRDLLAKRLARSLHAFEHIPDHPGGESYLIVMEDPDAKRLVGACGITSKTGGYQPFYAYRIETSLFESKVIDVRKEVPILMLHEEHDGPCEIGSLFLHPDFRGGGNGRLLQLVRFLFIAEHPQAFEQTTVSEIRGVTDDQGNSPFWNAIGRHFFDIDFARADYLSIVNKKFIADLMPDHPIYIPLLPQPAREVIGVPNAESRRAVKNLEAEGFTFSNMVDIFDAGPILSCPTERVRSVRESRTGTVGEITRQPIESPVYMMGTSGGAPFRATKGELDATDPADLRLGADAARALRVTVGDTIRYVTLFVGSQ